MQRIHIHTFQINFLKLIAYNLKREKIIHRFVQSIAGKVVETTQTLLCHYSQLHPKEIVVECDKQPVETGTDPKISESGVKLVYHKYLYKNI